MFHREYKIFRLGQIFDAPKRRDMPNHPGAIAMLALKALARRFHVQKISARGEVPERVWIKPRGDIGLKAGLEI